MANKVNRNLSPSLARIQNLKSKVDLNNDSATNKRGNLSPASEPRLATAKANETQDLPTGETNKVEHASQPSPPGNNHHTPTMPSALTAPWIIASITLTLALFSGNYAWQTQKEVETLSQRLGILEAQKVTSFSTELQKSNDNVVDIEQALLHLRQTQGQQTTTIGALTDNLATAAEQTNSRLQILEEQLVNIASQAQEKNSQQESALDQRGKEPPLTTPINSQSSTESVKEKTQRDLKSIDPENLGGINDARIENWNINIASFSDTNTANNLYKKVRKIADTAAIKPITVKGKTLHRIRAEGYNSRAGAEKAALALQKKLGLSGLWVSHD